MQLHLVPISVEVPNRKARNFKLSTEVVSRGFQITLYHYNSSLNMGYDQGAEVRRSGFPGWSGRGLCLVVAEPTMNGLRRFLAPLDLNMCPHSSILPEVSSFP